MSPTSPEDRDFYAAYAEANSPGYPLNPAKRKPFRFLCECADWHTGHVHTPSGLQPVEDDKPEESSR